MKFIEIQNRQEWEIFEEFKAWDLRQNGIKIKYHPQLLARILVYYPFFRKVDDWIIYDKIENYGDKTFKIGSLNLEYYRGWKGNRESMCERAVEIALGNWFLDKFPTSVEVGAVMPYYRDDVSQIVVDPYDKWPNCDRTDGVLYNYKGKSVFSGSSIEHVGYDRGYEDKEENKAIKMLEKIINESDNYLVEWGIGQHPILDEYVQNSKHLNVRIMVRENFRGSTNNWREDNSRENFYLPYGSIEMGLDFYGNSLALAIVTNLDDILC